MNTLMIALSSVISSLGIMVSVCNLYIEKVKTYKKILYVLCLSTIFFVLLMFSSSLTRLIINYLGALFLNYFILLDRNIQKSIAYTSVTFIGTAILEVLLSIILKSVINFDDLYNKYILTMVIFNLIVSILLIIVTKIKLVINISNRIKISNKVLKLVLFLIILLSCLIGIRNKNIVDTNSLSYIINILMFVFVITITFVIININYKNNEINNRYNQMMEYMAEYETIIDEQGKKNHEYNNQLMILKGFIDSKKKLKDYLDTIIDDHKTGGNYDIRQLSHFPKGGLKGLLYYKINEMKDKGIKYYLYVSKEVTKPLEKIDLKNYKDITKIFGVLIDNAIDGALESIEKEIIIDFKKDENYLVITLSNSINSNIELSKVGTGFSTKGKGHGYGLRLVKDIIKNNNNVELITDKNEKEFIQTILINTN